MSASNGIGPKRLVVGAHYGVRDWIAQRATAGIMAVYTVILLAWFFGAHDFSYEGWASIFSRSRRTIASPEAGEWWQTGKISSSSASARSTSSTMPARISGTAPGPSAKAVAASTSCVRSALNTSVMTVW